MCIFSFCSQPRTSGSCAFQKDFPDWPIVLAIPNTKGAHDAEEVDIFKKYCPIPLAEVQEICHVILMQMLPALVEEDLESFGKAINHIQLVGFKKREVELQPRPVLDIMEYMRDNGASWLRHQFFRAGSLRNCWKCRRRQKTPARSPADA